MTSIRMDERGAEVLVSNTFLCSLFLFGHNFAFTFNLYDLVLFQQNTQK